MSILFVLKEEQASVLSRKSVKKIANDLGLVKGKDFQMKRVGSGWICFQKIKTEKFRNWWENESLGVEHIHFWRV